MLSLSPTLPISHSLNAFILLFLYSLMMIEHTALVLPGMISFSRNDAFSCFLTFPTVVVDFNE